MGFVKAMVTDVPASGKANLAGFYEQHTKSLSKRRLGENLFQGPKPWKFNSEKNYYVCNLSDKISAVEE